MRTLIIIPTSLKDAANDAARTYFTEIGDEDVFAMALYPVNQNPQTTPSHYVCCAKFTSNNRTILGNLAQSFSGSLIYDYDIKINPTYPKEVFTNLNLKMKVE